MPHWPRLHRGDVVLSTCHWKMTLKAPAVKEAHEVFIWAIQADRTRGPASSASWAGFSDCSFQTKHPSRNTGNSRRIGNCSGACGVAVLVTEGREGIRLPAGGTWVITLHMPIQTTLVQG